MAEERICQFCRTKCTEDCPTCLENYKNRRPAHQMTTKERANELKSLLFELPPEIPLHLIHIRIDELVGRAVESIEIGVNPKGLIAEICNKV